MQSWTQHVTYAERIKTVSESSCDWCTYWQIRLGPHILCPECEIELSKSNSKIDRYLDEHPLS